MPAVGLKVALAAGAALVVLVPAFNSLNQVTVEDAEPPFEVDEPPPNLPPPQEGDDFQAQPEEGPQPESEECPPPRLEPLWAYVWEFPPGTPGRATRSFDVSPGSAGIAYVGNLSNFVGRVAIALTDPEGSDKVVYEFDSADPDGESGDRVGDGNFNGVVQGAVPGPWDASVTIGTGIQGLLTTPASGHVDVQFYQVFPCGGAGAGAPAAFRQGGA